MSGFSINSSTTPSSSSSPFSSLKPSQASSPFSSNLSSSCSPSPAASTTAPPALGSSMFSNPSSTTSSPFSFGSAPLFGSSPTTGLSFKTSFSGSSLSANPSSTTASSNLFGGTQPSSTLKFAMSSGSTSSSSQSPLPAVGAAAAASGSSASTQQTSSTLGLQNLLHQTIQKKSRKKRKKKRIAASFCSLPSCFPSVAPSSFFGITIAPATASATLSSSSSPFSTWTQSYRLKSTTSAAATATCPSVLAVSSSATSSSVSFGTPQSTFQSSSGLTNTTHAIATTSSARTIMPTLFGVGVSNAPSIASTTTTTCVVAPAVTSTPALTPPLSTSQAGNASSLTASIPVCGVTTSLTAYASTSAANSTTSSALTSSPSAATALASQSQPTPSGGMTAEAQVKIEGVPIDEDEAAGLDGAKYPDANQLFEDGLHVGATLKGDYVEVGGFHIQKCHEQLYTCIWKKYGHIATSTVLCDAYEVLVAATTEFLVIVEDMYQRPLSEVTSDIMEKWGKRMKLARNLKFNISWLEDRLLKMEELTARHDYFSQKLANYDFLLAEDGYAWSTAKLAIAELEKQLAKAKQQISELHAQRVRLLMGKKYLLAQMKDQIAAYNRSLLFDLFK